MIKWNCNFNIQDSTVQLDVAYIKIVSAVIINDKTEVQLVMTNDTGDVLVKEFTKSLDMISTDYGALYIHILNDYENAEIIEG